MAKLTTSLLIGTALFTAACAKKPPAVIPPPPGQSVVDPNAGQPSIAPGSRADFERSVTSNTVNFYVSSC